MKNTLITILLFATGIGIVLLFLNRKPPVSTAAVSNPGTATKTPPTPYSDFLALFGVPRSTGQNVDNTGQLISSAGGAFSSTVKSFSDLFKSTPTSSVTSSPANNGIYGPPASAAGQPNIVYTDVAANP